MLILQETPAGFGLFRLKKASIADDPENVGTHGKSCACVCVRAFAWVVQALASVRVESILRSLVEPFLPAVDVLG